MEVVLKRKRNMIKFAVILFMLAGICAGQGYAKNSIPIDIVVDGNIYEKVELILIKQMGYLKARDVADIFKASINYDKDTKELLFIWLRVEAHDEGEGGVKFTVGSEYVIMDGIKRKMMKKTQMIDNRVYVPLEAVITRAFEAVVGAQINWSFPEKTLWVSYKGNIADVRHYSYANYSRFVVELTGDLAFKTADKENILEISVSNGRLTVPTGALVINDGVIERVDIEEMEQGIKFLIQTGANAGDYKIKKLPGPVRIVVDIENTSEKPNKIESADELPPVPAGPAKRDKVRISDIKLVVIDPGHGGKDPGAIGRRGTKEKDITLRIAKKLAKKIRKRLKIRTILTRTHDYFVPLAERTKIANSKNADIFISIHTNASLNPKSQGFEVYFLSGESSDKEAQAVANMENSVLAMEAHASEMNRVSKILWSLTMNQFMNESSEFCSFINKCVISETGLIDRGVKQAGFYVMRGARMPSVLVEAAFLSNKKEEKLLNKNSFQEEIADAICDAVKKYKNWVRKR